MSGLLSEQQMSPMSLVPNIIKTKPMTSILSKQTKFATSAYSWTMTRCDLHKWQSGNAAAISSICYISFNDSIRMIFHKWFISFCQSVCEVSTGIRKLLMLFCPSLYPWPTYFLMGQLRSLFRCASKYNHHFIRYCWVNAIYL